VFAGQPLALGGGLLDLRAGRSRTLLFGPFALGLLFGRDLLGLDFDLAALGFGLRPLGLDLRFPLFALGLHSLLGRLRLGVSLHLLQLPLAVQAFPPECCSGQLLRPADHLA